VSWLSEFVRPKIRALVGKNDVPDNLWHKCPACEQMLFHRELKENQHVCHACGHHLRINARQRLELLFDDGAYTRIDLPAVTADPLKFRDSRRYTDRLKDAQAKSGEREAIIVAHGRISGQSAVVAAFDFSFMGGSMGQAVGTGLLAAADAALAQNAALIAIPASGGARMQEGMLSLVQMPRTVIAVDQVREAGLPYIVLLTDPTTGGVSASFAMLGDIQIAEPGATIGFAGKRVIQDTVREELPEGFQTAEYLREHGMVDMVVPRADLPATLGRLLSLLRENHASDGFPRVLIPASANPDGN
jgi:acetyl-CoA carboxylase carboxyl transferase subunit beta